MMETIRTATMQDLDAIMGVVSSATRHMDSQGIHQWDDIYPDRGALQADIEKRHLHVMDIGGQIVGTISLNDVQSPEYSDVNWEFSGKALVVHRLSIAPSHQRQGLATRLMEFTEQEAEKQGYNTIRFDAFTENPGATALYEHLGYRKAGTVRFRKGLFYCFEKRAKTIEAKERPEPVGGAHVTPAAGATSAHP